MWLATRPWQRAIFHQAGTIRRLQPGGVWMALVPEEHWPDDPESIAQIKADWDPEWGDRMQEMVLIGAGMDQDGIIEALTACLLTERGNDCGEEAWVHLNDPLPAWPQPEPA